MNIFAEIWQKVSHERVAVGYLQCSESKMVACSQKTVFSKRSKFVTIHKMKQLLNSSNACQSFWESADRGQSCTALSALFAFCLFSQVSIHVRESLGPQSHFRQQRWSPVFLPTPTMTSHTLSRAWSRALRTARATLYCTARARLSVSRARIHANRPVWSLEVDSTTTHGRQVSDER